MKISQLNVEGFRSLKNITWTPGDLNVVIGPNGSGKSNLLRLLEMISVSMQGGLAKYIQAAGGMDPLVWDGRVDQIVFRLKTSPVDILKPPREVICNVRIVRLGKSSYRVEDETVEIEGLPTTSDKPAPTFLALERYGSQVSINGEDGGSVVSLLTPNMEQEVALSAVRSPFITKSNQWLSRLPESFEGWKIYQDVRVDQGATLRQAAIARFDKQVDSDGQNLVSVLHTLYTGDRQFEEDVNVAMNAAFGDDFDKLVFPPAADQRIQLRVRWKTLSREQSAADLSDGTLRFLFLITVLANPSPPPLIAIDEPETGLHPSMLPIVAEYAVQASRRTQVILTTHSDQFLDAFTETRPTTTVAKWENGETTLNVLDDEALAYWLKEYRLGNLFRSGELENMA